ncbi:MAG: PLP-dependent aspartate aminotransferase family protein [Armatimonadota bacterium]|nr:PLP-dependent aspartate aminotransferase family protein [Armatimonadota bacterium]
MKFSTKTIRLGQEPTPPYRTIIPPLYQSATFAWENLDEAPAYDYTRVGNPTRAALEEVYAGIENAKFGLAQATGMAAIATVCSMLQQGDHIAATEDIYGGTYRLFEIFLKKQGISVTYFDETDSKNLEAAIKPNTKLVWLETPTNPTLRICDIVECCEIAKRIGALSALDNTFASPYLQNPLDMGCDIVMHSTTKYINGHSDVVGGALMWNREDLTEPLTLYAKSAGNGPSPFDCWLTLRGVKTLALRMDRHCENAAKVAEFLEAHPKVSKVHYPGLKSHPQHDLAARQMRGSGGMVSFELAGGVDAAKRFATKTKVFILGESLGGVESLMAWPPMMSHATMTEEQRVARGIPGSLLRLSVGIEETEDQIADIDQALAAV